MDEGNDTIARQDGRKFRSVRTRERILNATRMLMREGTWRPPVLSIANLAGVSTRSIFQHFDDTRALYAAVLLQDADLRVVIALNVLQSADQIMLNDTAITAIAHAAVTGRPLQDVEIDVEINAPA